MGEMYDRFDVDIFANVLTITYVELNTSNGMLSRPHFSQLHISISGCAKKATQHNFLS